MEYFSNYLGLQILLQSLKSFTRFFVSSLECLGFLGQGVAFARGNVNLSLLSIDLRSPGLKFFLLGLNLIVENLCFICGQSSWSNNLHLGKKNQTFQAILNAFQDFLLFVQRDLVFIMLPLLTLDFSGGILNGVESSFPCGPILSCL